MTPAAPGDVSAQPDGGWEATDLPHDWLIRSPRALCADGDGWYRKRFSLPQPAGDTGLRFDGVYMDCTVWLNGCGEGVEEQRFPLDPPLTGRSSVTLVFLPGGRMTCSSSVSCRNHQEDQAGCAIPHTSGFVLSQTNGL